MSHTDDEAVDRFAAAMKAKLAKKRAEGRGGWEDKEQCSRELLSTLLREHVEKGDPLDIMNFAMMLHQRGETVAPASVEPVKEIDAGRFEEWSLPDFAAQCRMQSREQLDPEFSQFMGELGKRLTALTAAPASAAEPVAWQQRLSALKEAVTAIEQKIEEARSFGVEQRELTAMGWCLDALQALKEQWPQKPTVTIDT